jgi:hypothetical protein
VGITFGNGGNGGDKNALYFAAEYRTRRTGVRLAQAVPQP